MNNHSEKETKKILTLANETRKTLYNHDFRAKAQYIQKINFLFFKIKSTREQSSKHNTESLFTHAVGGSKCKNAARMLQDRE